MHNKNALVAAIFLISSSFVFSESEVRIRNASKYPVDKVILTEKDIESGYTRTFEINNISQGITVTKFIPQSLDEIIASVTVHASDKKQVTNPDDPMSWVGNMRLVINPDLSVSEEK